MERNINSDDKNIRLELLVQKMSERGFKIWKDESYLDGSSYTVMHIESVFDIISFISEYAAIYDNLETFNFVNKIDADIRKAIGREDRYDD